MTIFLIHPTLFSLGKGTGNQIMQHLMIHCQYLRSDKLDLDKLRWASIDGMRVDFPWAIFRWKFHIKIHGKYALGNKKPNCMRKVEFSTGIKSVV